MTTDMADLFLADLRKQTDALESFDAPLPQRRREDSEGFAH